MPSIITTYNALYSLEFIDSSLIDDLDVVYEEQIENGLAQFDGSWSFTTISATLIEAASAGYTVRLTGSGLSPVSSAQELEDAINGGFASGALDKLALRDNGVEILAFETVSDGYRFSTDDLSLDVAGTLPGTLDGIQDLIEDLTKLADSFGDLSEPEEQEFINRLSTYSATGVMLSDAGKSIFSVTTSSTGSQIELIGYTANVANSLPNNLGSLTAALFDLEDLADSPSAQDLNETLQNIASFGALDIRNPEGDQLLTMSAEDVDDALLEDEDIVFDVDGEIYDDILLDIADSDLGNNGRLFASDDASSLMLGYKGDDLLIGSSEADVIIAGRGDDSVDGGDGDDDIQAGTGDDFVYGLGGNDTIRGGTGVDTVFGGDGDDVIRGQRKGDGLSGGEGNDNIKGGGGRDELRGEGGNDFLKGGTRQDTINGGDGNDRLIGNSFDDLLLGGDGNDTLNAGGDNDTMNGGDGDDQLKGGSGADVFEFDVGEGNDVFLDFDVTEDLFEVYYTFGTETAQDLVDNATLGNGGVTFTFADYPGGGGSVFILGVTDKAGLADVIEIFT